jgi:hypothetical protein
MDDIARVEWGGAKSPIYITSDCTADLDVFNPHNFTKTPVSERTSHKKKKRKTRSAHPPSRASLILFDATGSTHTHTHTYTQREREFVFVFR